MTDPTTILREAIKAVVIESEADDVLATRIPQACQTCNEHGMRYTGRPETGPWEPCPDCPTIGTLLLWGWNVAQAEWRDEQTGYRVNDWLANGWNALLGDLREVPT